MKSKKFTQKSARESALSRCRWRKCFFFYHKSWLLKKSFFNPLDQPCNKNKINFENIFGFFLYLHTPRFSWWSSLWWTSEMLLVGKRVQYFFYYGRIIDWHTKFKLNWKQWVALVMSKKESEFWQFTVRTRLFSEFVHAWNGLKICVSFKRK